jgi:hypothetical protein
MELGLSACSDRLPASGLVPGLQDKSPYAMHQEVMSRRWLATHVEAVYQAAVLRLWLVGAHQGRLQESGLSVLAVAPASSEPQRESSCGRMSV